MSNPAPLKFDSSLRTFPTFRCVCRGAVALLTLGRYGATDRSREVVDRYALPDTLRDIVLRTTRATGLWTSERAEVARELASHFRGGLDAGASAETLASTFGDVSTSAVLIRRATKRKRPLAWRMWARFWQGVALLLVVMVLLYALFTARYYSGAPTINRNYFKELNDRTLALPESQRAWPEYRRALMAMPDWPNQAIMDDWGGIQPDDPQYVVAKAYINAAQPQLDIIRAAANRPALGTQMRTKNDWELDLRMAERQNLSKESLEALRQSKALEASTPGANETNPNMFGVLLPHLGRIRGIARDFIFDATVARQEGDADRLASDILATLGLADQCGHEDTLIGQLVANAVLAVATNETRRTLTQTPSLLTDDQLTAIAHRMATCIRPGDLHPDLAGERMFFDDIVQRVFTDDGHGDGRLTNEGMDLLMDLSRSASLGLTPDATGSPSRASEHAMGPVYAQVFAGRKDMVREYNRVMDQATSDYSRPAWQRMSDPNPYSYMQVYSDPVWKNRYLPVSVMVPALDKCFWAAESQTLERNATLVAIACELHKRRSGAWPASLADIPRSLLPAVPTDPFTGQPLLYRLIDAGPVVYSTGSDRDDDQGVGPDSANWWRVRKPNAPENGDWVLWPMVEPQY